jgi:hypothetical protein
VLNCAGGFNEKLEFSAAVEKGGKEESETPQSPEAGIG